MFASHKKAFNIMEVVIAISIITILSLISMFFLKKWIVSSRDGKRYTDINSISTSIGTYYFQNKIYPAPSNGVYIHDYSGVLGNIAYQGIFDSNSGSGGVIDKIPLDPVDNTYYTYTRIDLNPGGYELAILTEDIPKFGFTNNSKVYADNYIDKKYPYLISHYNVGTFSGITLPCASFYWMGTGYVNQTNLGQNNTIEITTNNKQVMQISGSVSTNTGNFIGVCDYMYKLGITSNVPDACVFGDGQTIQGSIFENCSFDN